MSYEARNNMRRRVNFGVRIPSELFEASLTRDVSRNTSQMVFELGDVDGAADFHWPRREIVQQRWDARRAQHEAKALLAECVEHGSQSKNTGRL